MLKNNNPFLYILLATVGSIAFAFLVAKPKMMSPVWSVPYFSGAVNSSWDGNWKWNPADTDKFKKLNTREKRIHVFEPSSPEQLEQNNHNNIGYLYVVKVAHFLWGSIGTVNAVVLLQTFIHLICCGAIFTILRQRTQKILFLVLYALNPVILLFVTMPFYYFWQTIPSFMIAALLLQPNSKAWVPALGAAIAGLTFIIRPTVLGVALGLIFYCAVRKSWKTALACIFLFFGTTYFLSPSTQVQTQGGHWHTIFIGIGAYPNPELPRLSDREGYLRGEKVLGVKVNASIGGNLYDPYFKNRYYEALKNEYLTYAQTHPVHVLRNGSLNTLQSFSVGYINDLPIYFSYISSLVGLIFLAILIWRKLLWWAFFIFMAGATFTPYYPPIQAYMFGSYVLLVLAFIVAITSKYEADNCETL